MGKSNLTEIEIAKIESFVADEVMFDAVKKVLLKSLYSHGVFKVGEPADIVNGAFNQIAGAYAEGSDVSNDNLGQRLRALYEGVHALAEGFAQLKTIKSKNEGIVSPFNEAI